jgi:predicted transcriptional regulator
MNGLLAAMAVANPVITALLTIIVFLEKDKLRKRSEDIEAAFRQCNQELVQTVANQSNELEKIAHGLADVNNGLGVHIEKASEVVTKLTNTITESSTTLIGEATAKTVAALTEVKDEVKKIEAAQMESAQSVKNLQEALKQATSL